MKTSVAKNSLMTIAIFGMILFAVPCCAMDWADMLGEGSGVARSAQTSTSASRSQAVSSTDAGKTASSQDAIAIPAVSDMAVQAMRQEMASSIAESIATSFNHQAALQQTFSAQNTITVQSAPAGGGGGGGGGSGGL